MTSDLVAMPPSASAIAAQATNPCPTLTFVAALESFLAAAPSPSPHLAVALSGGADSMALALLTHSWAIKTNARITALTVDHGLRLESAAEAAQVATWMHARGIDHHILTPPSQPAIRNAQTAARTRRYEALSNACADLGCSHLLLAHHADDQAETLLLQQHRGSTPPSRCGMPAMRYHGNTLMLRPLLGVRKASLIHYLQAQQQPWVEDPSNKSDRYARNRLRKTIREEDVIAAWHEAQAAGKLRHAQEVARNIWMQTHSTTHHNTATLARLAWLELPIEQRMDYASHAIRCVGGKNFRPRMAESERLCGAIIAKANGHATLGLCKIRWDEQRITIRPEHKPAVALETQASAAHIEHACMSQNMLVTAPFWWFSLPLNSTP